MIAKVSSTTPEQTISVSFLRETGNRLERRTAAVTLGERPSKNASNDDATPRKLSIDNPKKPLEPFGLTLSELTPKLASDYRHEGEKGVVVKDITPASFIADVKNSKGSDALNEGDLIQRINRVPVTDLKTFNATAGKLKTGDAVVLEIRARNGAHRIVQFTVQ